MDCVNSSKLSQTYSSMYILYIRYVGLALVLMLSIIRYMNASRLK